MSDKEDHLSSEISVSFESTANGLKAGAKSRTLAAIDRLAGAVLDIGSAHLEGYAARRRAKTEGELKILGNVAEHAVGKLGSDPELADRAITAHYRKVIAQQENKDAVVVHALEDLRQNPPPQDDQEDNAELSPEFLDRIETYSSGASTEALRARWGRVLAAEVRKPGTVSAKVMRVVDELDAETALLFERLCAHRLNEASIPLSLCEKLQFLDLSKLVVGDLVVDPGSDDNHIQAASKTNDTSGTQMWIFNANLLGIAFPSEHLLYRDSEVLVHGPNNEPAIPIYFLTPAGVAIASILPDNLEENTKRLADVIAKSISGVNWVRLYRKLSNERFVLVEEKAVNTI